MATSGRAPEVDFACVIDENAVQIEFIDEDNLPLACINFMEHPESEEELGSDFLSESSGDESEEAIQMKVWRLKKRLGPQTLLEDGIMDFD